MNKCRAAPHPQHRLCNTLRRDNHRVTFRKTNKQVTFLHFQAAIPAIRAAAASLALATFALTEPAIASGCAIERNNQKEVVTHSRTIQQIGRIHRTNATTLPAISIPWGNKSDSNLRSGIGIDNEDAAVAARRRIANEAVEVFESRYVDAGSVSWNRIRRRVARSRLRNDAELERVIRSVLEIAGDAYTRYLPARELAGVRDGISGAMEGVGLVFSAETRGFRRARRVSVTHVVRGSPAHEAGIMKGDEIVAIDTQRVASMRIDDAAARMAGRTLTQTQTQPKGTVLLTIVRRSQGTRELSVVLTRRRFSVPTVTSEFIPLVSNLNNGTNGYNRIGNGSSNINNSAGANVAGNSSNTVTVTRLNVPVACYMRVRDFANRTTNQAARTFRSARLAHNTKVIIIDLRGNSGGLVDQAVSFARLLLPRGCTVVKFIGRNGATSVERTRRHGRAPNVPIIVLVDDRTASASELVAAALTENCRAIVVGTRTFGKGSVQAVVPLSDGSGVAVTVAAYRTPNGRRIEDGVGYRPDWHKPDLPDDPQPIVHALFGNGNLNIQERRFKWVQYRINRCTPPQLAIKSTNNPFLSLWYRNR